MPEAPVMDVSSWEARRDDPDEPLGARGSTWLIDPSAPEEQALWVFKPVRARTQVRPADPSCFEEDWAEYVATSIGALLDLPIARIELAVRDGQRGVVSPSFVLDPAHPPTFGNELLFAQFPDYPVDAKGEVPGYTLQRCLDVLERHQAPLGADPAFTSAVDAFAGYLLLDAVVANTDRHHENWSVLQHHASTHLAPCYDLGTCLGFQLTDGERRERLETADNNRTVRAWAHRGASRSFDGRPNLADLATEAFTVASQPAQTLLLERLTSLTDPRIADVVSGVPADRMSQWAGRFAMQVLSINRERLLERLP